MDDKLFLTILCRVRFYSDADIIRERPQLKAVFLFRMQNDWIAGYLFAGIIFTEMFFFCTVGTQLTASVSCLLVGGFFEFFHVFAG